MMKSWLFKEYDPTAFGIFRICFYFSVFIFYMKLPTISVSEWFDAGLIPFFEPISFFKFFSYSSLQLLNNFDLQFWWYVSLVLSGLGILFPITSMMSFLLMLFGVGVSLNFGKIHHANHLMIMILGILAFSFNAGNLSFDSWISKKLRLPEIKMTSWAIQTARIYMCIIYFSSGYQKMVYTGFKWIFSDNMQTIISTRPTITPLGLFIAQYPLLCQLMALVTVVAQLGAPLALFRGVHRYVIMGILFMLHIGTYAVMGNHGFFFGYNFCFLVWLPWEEITQYLKSKLNGRFGYVAV
jgi:uncharacterized membrane protein YphA (DoxX/SURF4 family)